MIASTGALRVASYNVHECVGTDGVRDPARIAAVLAELDVGVVGLQEVASQPGSAVAARQLDYLAEATGMKPVYGPTLLRRGGEYGNGLLARFPVERVQRHDLSVPGFEPRGALDTFLALEKCSLRVVVTHLGLDRVERARQALALREILRPGEPGDALVLLGDLNEWWLLGAALRLLRRTLGRAPAPATFPARFPLLALDRVWTSPPSALARVWTHRTRLARTASDHLPVVASLWPSAAAELHSQPHP